jgi:hypothetical protein
MSTAFRQNFDNTWPGKIMNRRCDIGATHPAPDRGRTGSGADDWEGSGRSDTGGPAGEAHEFGRSCERREMAMDIDVLLFETASAVIVAVVLLAIFRHI